MQFDRHIPSIWQSTSCSFPSTCFCPGSQNLEWLPFCGTGFKSNQEVVGCTQKVCATSRPADTSFLTFRWCYMQHLQPNGTTGENLPQQASIYLTTLWKPASMERASSVVPAWFLCHVTSSCIVFCHRNVSNSGMQPTAVAVTFHLGGFGDLPGQQFIQRLPTPGTATFT